MPAWLIKIIFPWLLHALKRFWSVAIIALIIFSACLGYNGFKTKIFDAGYKAGYSKAMQDRPTYNNVGTVVNQAKPENGYKVIGLKLNIWKFKLGLGV